MELLLEPYLFDNFFRKTLKSFLNLLELVDHLDLYAAHTALQAAQVDLQILDSFLLKRYWQPSFDTN